MLAAMLSEPLESPSISTQCRVALCGLNVPQITLDCRIDGDDSVVYAAITSSAASIFPARMPVWNCQVSSASRGDTPAIFVFRLPSSYHSRKNFPPPFQDFGLPPIGTSCGLGLPSDLTTGTNCHLPFTARYCLRLALRQADLLSNYYPCLPDLKVPRIGGSDDGTNWPLFVWFFYGYRGRMDSKPESISQVIDFKGRE